MVINAIRGGLRRFAGYFATYRWELCLLVIGIPFIRLWRGTRRISSPLALNTLP